MSDPTSTHKAAANSALANVWPANSPSDIERRLSGSGAAATLAMGQFVEGLLNSYLKWAADLTLQVRILDLAKLPNGCEQWIGFVNETNLPWVAWETSRGLVTATGQYDHEQSIRTGYWVLLIDWSLPPHSRNSSWWRSDPRRPREWTAGRSLPAEAAFKFERLPPGPRPGPRL